MQTPNTGLLQQYYKTGYDTVRLHCPECFVFIAPREFELSGTAWQSFMADPSHVKVYQDLHRRGLLQSSAMVRHSGWGRVQRLQ